MGFSLGYNEYDFVVQFEFQSPKSGQWDSLGWPILGYKDGWYRFQSPKSGQWDSLYLVPGGGSFQDYWFQSPKSGQWDSLAGMHGTLQSGLNKFQSPKSGQWDSLVIGITVAAIVLFGFNPLNRGNGILSLES